MAATRSAAAGDEPRLAVDQRLRIGMRMRVVALERAGRLTYAFEPV
jgi:hypothetical protein